MSTSGSILPTGAQEDPGDNPYISAESVSQEALVPSPSSQINSPQLSPTKPAVHELSIAAANEENSFIPNKPTVWPLDNIPLEALTSNNEKSVKFFQENRSISTFNHADILNEKLSPSSRLSPSGREGCRGSREWNIGSSQYGWDKDNPPPEMYLDGGGDGLASVESDDDPSPLYGSSTPPAARWALSLRNLLCDKEGCELFEAFLNEDGSKHPIKMLKFWYACRGLRKEIHSDKDTRGLIKIIWSNFIECDSVKVSIETKSAIAEKIRNSNLDISIFDQAQLEVEALMNETLYPNFLKSDLYACHYWGNKDGLDSQASPGTFGASALLPTVHEEFEYEQSSQYPKSHNSVRPKFQHKLTSDNLLASVLYRAKIERTRPEEKAGIFLKTEQNFRNNPYHAGFFSGHAVSLRDSEIQSLSSGAHTDDTKSYTDSSVDGIGLPMNSKHFKKLEKHRIRENASINKEDRLTSEFVGSTCCYKIPRTMRPDTLPSTPNPEKEREKFVEVLSEKLNKVIQEKENTEKLQHTFWKLNHCEDDPEEIRREHATNSLPPNLLVNKLHEKKVVDEPDLSQSDQSILDNHIRHWDPSTCSPGSPKHVIHSPPLKGGRGPCTKQLPHLSLPQPSFSQSTSGAFGSKGINKPSRHHSSIHGIVPHSSSAGYGSIPLPFHGTPVQQKGYYPPIGTSLPHAYQPRNTTVHGRRRERGQDVYSTFSSDSGNVADYHDGSERIPPSHLPKSKSMPEYMENNSVCAVSDGGSTGGRRQGFGSRRPCRRPTADLTDSGVSVVSDSGRSAAPSSTSERVETWLLQSRPFASSEGTSHAVAPMSEMDYHESQKVKGTRSTTHTVAGFTSLQRLTEGSVGRRSQCSSSTSAATCIVNNSQLLVQETFQPLDISRDSPLGQSQQYVSYERRKNRGGNGSSSSKSTGQGSCQGDGTGSNGSTLKKQQRITSKCDSGGVSSSNSTTPSQGPSLTSGGPLSYTTAIIYNFSDDDVPFMVKVQMRPVTLKKFKENLPKKGTFRFYFKKVLEDVGTVFEEITDDSEFLPLYDGKVFSLIRKDESKDES